MPAPPVAEKPRTPEPDLVAVGSLPVGSVFETAHTARIGVVLDQGEAGALVELDDLLFGGFEEKYLARDVRVHPREAQP